MPCPLAYVPLIDPLPIWSAKWLWPFLLIPLSLALAIVYKSIRCKSMDRVPREAAGLFVMIITGMLVAAVALATLARFMD